MDEVKLFCSKDCPDTCSFYATVNKNNTLSVKPIKETFAERGFVCKKLKDFYSREILYNQSQSFYLQEGHIKKKNAVRELVNFLTENKKKKILFYRGSGSLGYYMTFWDKLFSNFDNCYFVDGNPCDETGIAAHKEDFGICTNPPIENLKNTDTVILFGKNAYVTSQHLFVYLRTLKNNGKKIIYIDPIKSETARIADKFVQINPSTDGLLAYTILSKLGYTKHKDGLTKEIGITEQDIDYLSKNIKNKKTGIIEGTGLQRYINGKNSIQWINRLAYYTNNVDNLYYLRSSKEGLQKIDIERKHAVNIADITELMEKGFFDLIVVVAANPVITMPQSKTWISALKKSKVVVVDTNITETAKYADFFIKVGGMFAQEEIQGSYFFNKTHKRYRLKHIDSDTDIIEKISNMMGINIYIPDLGSVEHKKIPYNRIFTAKDIKIKMPYKEKGKVRLITISSSDYLNSQANMIDKETVFISQDMAKRLTIKDGDEVDIENDLGLQRIICRITDKIRGNSAFAHKNRSLSINSLTKSRKTDAENALSYYDLFLTFSL